MNYTALVGRITKDPEIRKTGTGYSVVNYTLAVNRNYKNENGEYDTDFISCVTYGISADNIAKYIHKGDLLGIKGTIQTRNYDDADGKKVYITEVMTERVTFLATGNKENKKDESGFEAGNLKAEEVLTDDDLPF